MDDKCYSAKDYLQGPISLDKLREVASDFVAMANSADMVAVDYAASNHVAALAGLEEGKSPETICMPHTQEAIDRAAADDAAFYTPDESRMAALPQGLRDLPLENVVVPRIPAATAPSVNHVPVGAQLTANNPAIGAVSSGSGALSQSVQTTGQSALMDAPSPLGSLALKDLPEPVLSDMPLQDSSRKALGDLPPPDRPVALQDAPNKRLLD